MRAPNESDGVPTRRTVVASLLMAVGVIAGFGLGFVQSLRYLVPRPAGRKRREMFVGTLDQIPVGTSLCTKDPDGQEITIVRSADDDEYPERGFKALSSKCPHLGCRVHWETGKDCFYCPCHQGSFDKEGIALSGPPAKESMNLATYEVKVNRKTGWVYLMVPEEQSYGV